MNYCGQTSAGTAGIMRMAENGELDAYLAHWKYSSSRVTRIILARLNLSSTSLLRFRKGTDEERLLCCSIMHLIEAQDVSLYPSKSNHTETDPRSKRCGKTFQGPFEKKFRNDYQRDLGKRGTAEFKEQLNKVKDEFGAIVHVRR